MIRQKNLFKDLKNLTQEIKLSQSQKNLGIQKINHFVSPPFYQTPLFQKLVIAALVAAALTGLVLVSQNKTLDNEVVTILMPTPTPPLSPSLTPTIAPTGSPNAEENDDKDYSRNCSGTKKGDGNAKDWDCK